MSGIIQTPMGTFATCVKTGVYFSIENDDRVFTGDLFYDFVRREMQIKGIPALEGRRRHVFAADFKGPVRIDLFLTAVKVEQPKEGDHTYVELSFTKGFCSSALATHIEEWHGDQSVMGFITENLEVKPDLTWFKQ